MFQTYTLKYAHVYKNALNLIKTLQVTIVNTKTQPKHPNTFPPIHFSKNTEVLRSPGLYGQLSS